MKTKILFSKQNGMVRKEIKAAYQLGEKVVADDIKDTLVSYQGGLGLDINGIIGYLADEGSFCLINTAKAVKFLNTEAGQEYIEDEGDDENAIMYAIYAASADDEDVGFHRYDVFDDDGVCALVTDILTGKI